MTHSLSEQASLFDPGQKPDDICRNRHGGNPESEEANQSVHESKEAVRRKVLEYAMSRGDRGVTADEVAEAWGVSHNHVAPRMSELRRDGRLIPTAVRRKTRTGCSARVLIAKR